MIEINSRLAIFILLAGVAVLVIGQAVESASVSQGPAGQVSAPAKDDNSDEPANEPAAAANEDDEDSDSDDLEEDYYEEYYEDEYDDEEEEEEEEEDYEEESLEEELAWLAQQHMMIKSDCAALNQTMASNGTDADSQRDYQNCQDELASVESDMRQLVDQIIGGGGDDDDESD